MPSVLRVKSAHNIENKQSGILQNLIKKVKKKILCTGHAMAGHENKSGRITVTIFIFVFLIKCSPKEECEILYN